ncbi:MAG: ATP-binding protein, partial [bacterium]
LPLMFSILSGLEVFIAFELRTVGGSGEYYYFANTWAGALNVAMYVSVLAYLLWGVANFSMQFQHSRLRKERFQIVSMLLGVILFTLFIILLFVFPENEKLHLYTSQAFCLLSSTLFAYIVFGGRLINLRRRGRQGLSYFLVTGLVFGFYFIVTKNIAELLGHQFNANSPAFEVLLVLILSIAILPLVVQVQSPIERHFYQDVFRYRQRFIRFSQESFRLPNLRDLANAVAAFLRESLSASSFDMMIKDEASVLFHSLLEPERALSLENCLPLLSKRDRSVYEVDELLNFCSNTDQRFLESFSGGYVISLLAEETVRGVLLIGPTVSGRPYSTDDVEFFAFFANGVSIAAENSMLLDKIRSEEVRVVKMEKLAALGRLTAGIAHEFRNPLNIISTSAQTILRNPDNLPLLRETGKYIIEEADRLSRTVDEFLQFAKPHTPTWVREEINNVIDNVMHALRGPAIENNVRLQKSIEGSIPPITTSPHHVERALINLGLNAIEAMPQGGELTILLEAKDTSAITINVRDIGPGIPTEYQARLFDPFFTTKPSGTGLGLVIAYMMVQTVQGKISFTTSDDGTTFSIELPIDGSQQ